MEADPLGSYTVGRQKEELSRRVRLLCDLWEMKKGRPLTYPQVVKFLETRKVEISRQRWSYLLSGNGFLVSDRKLLTALARFFKVDPEFLLVLHSPLPDSVIENLGQLQELRLQRVERYVHDQLGGLLPEALSEVLAILRRASDSGES